MDRPMTLPEMLRRSAEMIERGEDNAQCLMAIEHMLLEVREALYKARSGLEIDRMLGNGELK
jgi:hypothetical protein